NREAGSLPRVGRFCVRRRGRLPDRRRGHGHFGRGRLTVVAEEDPALPSYLSPACSAKSEMQSADVGWEEFDAPTHFVYCRFLVPEPGCGAHAKHRYHPG